MIRKSKTYLVILIIPFLFSSCASILNSKFQRVEIKTDEQITVLVDGRTPAMKGEKYLVRRDAIAKQITIKKEGYKDLNTALIQYKKSPYYAISVVPFSVAFLIPVLCDNMIKSRDYVSKISIENKMLPLPNKDEIASVLKLNNIKVNLNSNETYSWSKVPYRKFLHNKSLAKRKKNRESINLSVSYLTSKFISVLEKEGYMKYETNYIDKLYLNATATNYSESSYYSPAMAYAGTIDNYGSMITSNLAIKWEVLDNNKNVIFSHQTQTKSGQFAYGGSTPKREARTKAIKDGIHSNFIELVNSADFKKELKKRDADFKKYSPKNITKTDILEEQNFIDIITAENKDGILYLSKKNIKERASFRGDGTIGIINKSAVVTMVEDIPEFHSFAKKNINSGKGFTSSLISCYNDYKLTGKTKTLNQEYFFKFGLMTKKEYRNGPSDERLKTKQPIGSEIKHVRVTTTHYDLQSMETSSTVGENFRFKFTYGNAEYKKGFLLKNLSKAMGQDLEARKHIRKYRGNFAARTSLFLLGIAQAGLAINWASTGNTPFGLSTTGGIIALSPGIIFANWFNLFPQKYKTKNISNAINTYNQNLK